MSAFHYEYRVKGLQQAPAQVAGEMMEALEQSEKGLTPETLLYANRDENAPLHNEFEWDDTLAAEKYRLKQASGIIRNVYRITVETEKADYVRAFVPTGEIKNAYVSVASALTNKQWRANLLEQAKRDMYSFQAKYRSLSELSDVIAEMRKVG